MDTSQMVARLVSNRGKPAERFVWSHSFDPDDPQEVRIYLTCTGQLFFFCEILEMASALAVSAPVNGAWLNCKKEIWACDELIACEFDYPRGRPSDGVMQELMVQAVRSFRAYQDHKKSQQMGQPAEDKPRHRERVH